MGKKASEVNLCCKCGHSQSYHQISGSVNVARSGEAFVFKEILKDSRCMVHGCGCKGFEKSE